MTTQDNATPEPSKVDEVREKNKTIGREVLTELDYIISDPVKSLDWEANKLVKFGYGDMGYMYSKIKSLQMALDRIKNLTDEIKVTF